MLIELLRNEPYKLCRKRTYQNNQPLINIGFQASDRCQKIVQKGKNVENYCENIFYGIDVAQLANNQ